MKGELNATETTRGQVQNEDPQGNLETVQDDRVGRDFANQNRKRPPSSSDPARTKLLFERMLPVKSKGTQKKVRRLAPYLGKSKLFCNHFLVAAAGCLQQVSENDHRRPGVRRGESYGTCKRWTAGLRRHKNSKAHKGYYGTKSKLFRRANEQYLKSQWYAYRDRRNRKRDLRKLWITRINAAARLNGTTYSKLVHGLRQNQINLNRKILADLAVREPEVFAQIVNKAIS